MTFDPTITFGAVVNALVLLVGFAVAFTRIGGRIDLLTQRLASVEERIKEIGNVGTRIAVMESIVGSHSKMISALQDEINDLRHGRGFVQNRSVGGLDGEY